MRGETLAARLAGVPNRIYMLRGLKLETCTGLKRRILQAAEQMASASAQVVLCNSKSLRAKAQAMGLAPADKLHLLGEGSSNGVDLERFQPEPETPGERLLFIGSFRHFPNIAAYRFFTEQVWPLLRERFPSRYRTWRRTQIPSSRP